MKIILVGAGIVGSTLVHHLADKNSVTVIDKDPKIIDEISDIYDVMALCGNGASYDVLRDADAKNCDLLLATTTSDETNFLCCMVAKKLGVKQTIARVRNQEYESLLLNMRHELGLTLAINPERETAKEISRILRFPTALSVETFSRGRMELVQYRVREDCVLNGMSIKEMYESTKTRVRACAVIRKNEVFIPELDFVLEPQDRVYLTSSPSQLNQFFRQLGLLKNTVSSVILVGASKICAYLAQELINYGMDIKIIEKNRKMCIYIEEKYPEILVINGDATRMDLLREEGIDEVDAFVALTNHDDVNIVMSMCAAQESENCKIITKLKRRDLIDMVDKGDIIDSVVSARDVTSELILQHVYATRSATGQSAKSIHHLVGESVVALEFGVDANTPQNGQYLRDLKIKPGVVLAGIARANGRIVIPAPEEKLSEGDDIIVVTTDNKIEEIDDIFVR